MQTTLTQLNATVRITRLQTKLQQAEALYESLKAKVLAPPDPQTYNDEYDDTLSDAEMAHEVVLRLRGELAIAEAALAAAEE